MIPNRFQGYLNVSARKNRRRDSSEKVRYCGILLRIFHERKIVDESTDPANFAKESPSCSSDLTWFVCDVLYLGVISAAHEIRKYAKCRAALKDIVSIGICRDVVVTDSAFGI